MSSVKKNINKRVLNRSTLKSLRTIMEEDFTESVFSFLDKTLSLQSGLHAAVESQDTEATIRLAHEFADSCIYMGADALSEKLSLFYIIPNKLDDSAKMELLKEIDHIYQRCRQELQEEIGKNIKQAV